MDLRKCGTLAILSVGNFCPASSVLDCMVHGGDTAGVPDHTRPMGKSN